MCVLWDSGGVKFGLFGLYKVISGWLSVVVMCIRLELLVIMVL